MIRLHQDDPNKFILCKVAPNARAYMSDPANVKIIGETLMGIVPLGSNKIVTIEFDETGSNLKLTIPDDDTDVNDNISEEGDSDYVSKGDDPPGGSNICETLDDSNACGTPDDNLLLGMPHDNLTLEDDFSSPPKKKISLSNSCVPIESNDSLESESLSQLLSECSPFKGVPTLSRRALGLGEADSKTVKVGLKGEYYEDIFSFVIEEALKEAELYQADNCIESMQYSSLEKQVTIQFSSSSIAQGVVALLTNVEYVDEYLSFELAVPFKAPTLSCKVEFLNIPTPFVKKFFLHNLNNIIWKNNIVERPKEIITYCPDTCTDSSIIIELSSPEMAEKLCNLKEVCYRGQNLIRVHLPGVSSASTSCGSKMSSKVKLFDIPPPFMKKFFLHALNNVIWQENIVTRPLEIIIDCPETCTDSSIVIELSSPEMAEKLCNLKEVCYRGQNLKRMQLPEDAEEAFDSDFQPLKNLDFIESDSKDPDFWLGGEPHDSSDSDDADQLPVNLGSEEGTVIFLRHLVRLKDAFNSSNHEGVYTRLQADLKTDEKIDAEVSSLKGKRTYWLREYKKNINKPQWKYHQVCAVLKGDKEASCLDGTSFDPKLCKTSSAQDKNFSAQLHKYMKGAVWNEPATRMLIAVYGQHKQKFDQANRHSRLWKKISDLLKEKNHFFLPEACERKMIELKNVFRNEYRALQHTGAEGPATREPWMFYNDMYDIMKDDPTVEPEAVLAAGSSSHVRTKEPSKCASKTVSPRERSLNLMERIAISMEKKAEAALAISKSMK